MGAVMAIPFGYFFQKLFSNEAGIFQAIKEFIAHFYVIYLRRKTKRRFDLYDYDDLTDICKSGLKIPQDEWKLECPRNNLDFYESSDNIQFYGVNSSSESCFVRISKTSEDSANVWLHLRLSEGKCYSLPGQKEWKIPRTGDDCFAAGGLRIRCLSPMRKWRISYNGILTETNAEETKHVHVKFSLLWMTASEVFDFSRDVSPKLLADFLAKQKWKLNGLPNVAGILKYLDSYNQSGNLIGTISIGGKDEREILLWGGKKRSVEIQDLNSPTELLDFCGYLKDGESFHISQLKFPSFDSELKCGYLQHSNGLYFALDSCEMSLAKSKDVKNDEIVQTADLLFCEGRVAKNIHFELPTEVVPFWDSKNPKSYSLIHCSPVTFADETGHGIIISSCRSNNFQKSAATAKHFKAKTASKPLVKDRQVIEINNLGENDCDIAGGKGSSLGKLAEIATEDRNYSVPKGLVLTTSAYIEFLSNSEAARNSIALLEDVASGKITGILQDACENAVKTISTESLPLKVQIDLKMMLEELFGERLSSLKFAVRSSATGEDSEELSAAGQMDTLLGIRGFQQITECAVKCWASQFSYTAVQYKRQNGQVLNSPMAVVVQEMVLADSAGVIFTCDPLTGNPEIITITANYGIGESVVSARADPDTITLKRDIMGNVHLKNVQMGKKKIKVVMSESSGGVEERQVDPEDSEHCCLNEKIATELAELAIRIEEEYACPMDIEWAIKDGKIHLLQARPVTTFDRETDFEIIHENDSNLQCENEYVTIANIGEVMPGAFSTLGTTHFWSIFNVASNRFFKKMNPNVRLSNAYGNRVPYINSQHTHFNIAEFLLRFHVKEDSLMSTSSIISIFGRLIDDNEMFEAVLKRNGNYPNLWQASPLLQMFRLMKNMLRIGGKLDKLAPKFKSYKINLDNCNDSMSMLDEIKRQMNILLPPGQATHVEATTSSSIWNIFILYILQTASGSWNSEVFSDFSTLLSSISDIESAEVPTAMQTLSALISLSIKPSIFRAMKPEDALMWLKESNVGDKFAKFLDTHEHRCDREFDVRSKTWGIDPLPLVKILQELVGRTPTAKKTNLKKIASKNLNVQLSTKSKLILTILLPFARKGVKHREIGKSILIRTVHIARMAYLKLAKQMVKEGRLPDEDLLFFLSVHEIQRLLETRSPRIIQKAIRRRIIHPKIDALMFPEISKGFARPINTEEQNTMDSAIITMKGIPVSRGIAKGMARVAITVEEAKNIQQGEILIAHSTDIGWSPYFPLLAGVCTELGGLISHGAVVAREYGLPCVVSVHHATRKFKTGDMVLLDGNKGILQMFD